MVPKIGYPIPHYVLDIPPGSSKFIQQLLQAMGQHGWKHGENVEIVMRAPQSEGRPLTDAVQDLIKMDVKVIYAPAAPMLRASRLVTKSVPIVALDYTTDPVAAGYAHSYGRPGGNVTGLFLDTPQIAGKWIEILRSVLPRLTHIAVLWDPSPGNAHRDAVLNTARRLGIHCEILEVKSVDEIKRAFERPRKRTPALIILPSPMLSDHADLLAHLALKKRILAISPFRNFVDAGGALAYGPSQSEMIQRTAAMVARILSGTKPGDIPIERPTKFDFFFNSKTMQALNQKVPESLLLGSNSVPAENPAPRSEPR